MERRRRSVITLSRTNMLQTVEKYRVVYIPVSPPLVVALAKSDIVTKYDLSSLEFLGCGGASLRKEVAERFAARFPNVEISQRYGLTETAGGITRMIAVEEMLQYGSAGLLFENVEAKVVDPSSGEALGPRQRGELWLRGPSIMKGYVGDKEATTAAFDPKGWIKTGDICYFDEDGYLFIVDRLKELIKFNAYQVPPAELEHLLNSHPEVDDSAVIIPYPHEESWEIPMAYVVRKSGSRITQTQIISAAEREVVSRQRIGDGKSNIVSGGATGRMASDASSRRRRSVSVVRYPISDSENCAGAERFYVHQNIYSEFVAEVVKIVKSVTAGPPLSGKYDMGAICMQEHSERLRSLVSDALEKGAEIVGRGSVGNIAAGAVDQYFPPTVIVNVDHTMKLMQEEAFGPIMPIMKFSSDDEAVKLANDSKYGLGCAAFSGNQKHAKQIASKLHCGVAAINDFASGYMFSLCHLVE